MKELSGVVAGIDYKVILKIEFVVFVFDGETLSVLLLKNTPRCTLPECDVISDRTFHDMAKMYLSRHCNSENLAFEQIAVSDTLGRLTGDRVMLMTFCCLVDGEHLNKVDEKLNLFVLSKLPAISPDSKEKIALGLARLQEKIRLCPDRILVPKMKFTIPRLKRLFEAILQTPIDNRNFRKRLLAIGALERLDEKETHSSRKGAYLYRFKS